MGTNQPQHPITATFTSLSGWALIGFTIIVLMLATLLRTRSKSTVGSIKKWRLINKSKGAKRGLDMTHTLLAITALLLFAVAGIAAAGTPIDTAVTWASHTINTWFGHLPKIGRWITEGGISIVGLVNAWKFAKLVPDVIEGKAHQGEADLLVFAGPMLLPLIPGLIGQFWARIYSFVGAQVGAEVARLLQQGGH
jgi:hypothetical protein